MSRRYLQLLPYSQAESDFVILVGMATQCIYQRYVWDQYARSLLTRNADNILFNLPYVEARYQKTLEVTSIRCVLLCMEVNTLHVAGLCARQ
jgi:hypothetical protein